MTHHTPEGLPVQPSYYVQHPDDSYSLANPQPSAQAASVEPVGKIINSGGNTGSLPEHPLLVWLGGVPPVGTELYASAPPSPASVQDEALVEKLAKRTCEANADSARFTIALQTLRASLDPDDWMGAVTMHNYIDAVLAGGSPLQQHPAPSPAQAVMQVGCENIDGTLNIHPETETCSICEPAAAVPDGWALARAQDTSDYSRETIPEQVEDSLHDKIMNLRCMPDHEIEQAHEHSSPRFAYKCGHRDARHAAAELAALQAARQPQAQQDWALDVEALATKEPK